MIYRREALGLDIGTHAAKAVRAVIKLGRTHFRESGWVRLPTDLDERRRVLASFIERNGWQGLPCVVPLRGKAVMLHSIDMDPHDPRRIDDVVAGEMSQFNGLVDERTESDYALQVTPSGRRCVFLAVGRSDEIENAMRERDALGLDVTDAIPWALALFNTVSDLPCAAKGVFVCVDLGHDGTEVVVGHRRHILFARRFSPGAASFPESMRLPDSGDDQPEPTRGPATGSAANLAVRKWTRELQACLKLYTSQFADPLSRPRRVILCGGGAFADNLAEIVQEEIGLETTSLGSCAGHAGLDSVERYAKATGLAMAGLGRGSVSLSLLPPAVREWRTLRWQRRYWVMSALAVAASVLLVVTTTGVDLVRKGRMLDDLEGNLEEYRRLGTELLQAQGENDQLYRRILPFRTAAHNGALLWGAVQSLAEAKHPDDWITLIADGRSYFEQPPSPAPMDPEEDSEVVTEEEPMPGIGFGRLVLEGYTPVEDLSTVRTMIETLRTSPAIADADLLGDDQVRLDPERDARWAFSDCRLFAVELTLVRP